MVKSKTLKGYCVDKYFLSHPSFVFFIIWITTITLASIEVVPVFMNQIKTAQMIVLLLIVSNLFGAVVALLILGLPSKVRIGPIVYGFRRRIMLLWISISVIEIFSAGGIPLLWLIMGTGQTYEDFGIPTLHGIANAFWMYISFVQFIRLLDNIRDRKNIILMMVLALWPVLLVSRALFTIVLIQVTFFYLITTHKKNWNLLVRSLFLLVVFAFVFGIAGEARSDFSIVSGLGLNEDEFIFPALLWVYSYMVAPIISLSINWGVITPEFSIFPLNTFSSLLPSVVRGALGLDLGFSSYIGSLTLAHNAFNVMTAFMSPYLDWGAYGVVIMSTTIGFIGHLVWMSSLGNPSKIPLLCVINAYVLLTIFTNQFAGLPTILLLIMWQKLTKSNKNKP